MMLWSRNKESKRKCGGAGSSSEQPPLPQEQGPGGWWGKNRNRKKWYRLKEAEAKLIELAKTYYRPPEEGTNDSTIDITTIDTPIPYTALPIYDKKKRQKNGENLYMHSVCAKRRTVVTVVPEEGEEEVESDSADNKGSSSIMIPYLKKRSETNTTADESDDPSVVEDVDSSPTPPEVTRGEEEEAEAAAAASAIAKPATILPSKQQSEQAAEVPLVLLHGYMNGAMYYYRNIANLANHYSEVYSLDLLGCGLSSRRPKLLLKDLKAPVNTTRRTSPQATESMFVEAIEAWRNAMGISRMVLGGHSLGGYFAVAYCEKYPQHVQQLQLFSPAGIAYPEWDRITAYIRDLPLRSRTKTKIARFMFEKGLTPAIVIRMSDKFMRGARGKKMVYDYMKRRIPALPLEEQEALAEYFYRMACLKGTGEYIINRLLTYSSNAKVPLIDRIPNLHVSNVGFLYGISDWMGTDEGVEVMEKCQEEKIKQQQQQVNDGDCGSCSNNPPSIDVFEVMDAGHLLMLDEWKGFHGGVLALLQQQQQQQEKAEKGDIDNSDDNNKVLKNDVVESSISPLSVQQQQSEEEVLFYPKPVRKTKQKHKIRPLYFEKVDHDYEQNAAKAAAVVASSAAALNDDEDGNNNNNSPASAGSLKKFW